MNMKNTQPTLNIDFFLDSGEFAIAQGEIKQAEIDAKKDLEAESLRWDFSKKEI